LKLIENIFKKKDKYECVILEDLKIYEFEFPVEVIDKEINKLKSLIQNLNRIFGNSNYFYLKMNTFGKMKIKYHKKDITTKGFQKFIISLEDLDLKYVFQNSRFFTIFNLPYDYNIDVFPDKNIIFPYYLWCTDIGEVHICFLPYMKKTIEEEINKYFNSKY